MKDIKTLFLMIGFISFSIIGLKAQQVGVETYLKFDKNCMDIYDYEKSGAFYGLAFIDFHVKMSPHETFIFRVIKQSNYAENITAKTRPTLGCDDLRLLTKDFVKEVNEGHKIVYVLNGRGNIRYMVRKIVHYHESAKDLTYEDSHQAFSYAYDKIKSGEDLDQNENHHVHFLKREKLGCVNVRTFSSFNNTQTSNSEKISFVEGVGLYKIKNNKGAIVLKTVNNEPIMSHILKNCVHSKPDVVKGISESNVARGVEKRTTVKAKSRKAESASFKGLGGSFASRGSGANPLPVLSGVETNNSKKNEKKNKNIVVPNGYHLVKEGETLYKIAQKYNTREDVLIGLNNLKNTTIDHGTILKVVNDGTYKDQNPIIRIDEQTGMQLKIHIVRQGDNLWDIAKRYGTTTLALQNLNNLEDRSKLKISQQLLIEKKVL